MTYWLYWHGARRKHSNPLLIGRELAPLLELLHRTVVLGGRRHDEKRYDAIHEWDHGDDDDTAAERLVRLHVGGHDLRLIICVSGRIGERGGIVAMLERETRGVQ